MPSGYRVELKSIIPQIPPGAEREAKRIIEAAAKRMRDRGKGNIPRRTGETAESVRYVFVGSLVAEIGTDSPIGAYLELGTEPHLIRPVQAQVLHFFVNGEEVFTRLVQHPGTRPQPWLLPAYAAEKGRFVQAVRDELGGWLEDQSI